MQWITKLVAGFLILGSTLDAQQPDNPSPVPNQQEPRNLPVRLQPNQQGIQQRGAQRQNLPPFANRNDRDPREDAALDGQQQHGGTEQGQQDQGSIGGGGSSSGSMSSVVTVEQAKGLAAAEVIRSKGQFSRNTATAGVLQQQARGEAIENRYMEVKNRFEVRQLARDKNNEARGRQST